MEMVTVIDPRDPHYGRTFRLLFIENKSYRGKCCVVRMDSGIERHIPVSVTNQSSDPLQINPLPLNLSSVRQLLSVYERIIRLAAERAEDGHPDQNFPDADISIQRGEFPPPNSPSISATPSRRTLDGSNARTAAASISNIGDSLSSNRPTPPAEGRTE